MPGSELRSPGGVTEPPETVLAFLVSNQARSALVRAAGTRRLVRFSIDERGLIQATKAGGVDSLVWQIVPGADRMVKAVARAIEVGGRGTRVFTQLDLGRGTARRMKCLASYLPYASISLRSHDDLERDLDRWFRGDGERAAYPVIIKRIEGASPQHARDILCAAAVVGRRRTEVERFARACGLPLRTLEWRCARARLPTPGRLLGLMVSLHAAWRLDVLQFETRRAALAGGFSEPHALASYIARHCCATLSDLRRDGSFPALLERVVRSLPTAATQIGKVGPIAGDVQHLRLPR